MRIGIDIDLTVVRTDLSWIEWIINQKGCNIDFSQSGKIPYDLAKHIGDPTLREYWHDHIYEDLEPIVGSVEAIEELHKTHNIVFVSALMEGHASSKTRFIEKWFPFVDIHEHDSLGDGLIYTKQKGMVNLDVMVDDRLENLIQFNDKVVKVLFKTPYTQKYKSSQVGVDFKSNKWNDIKDFIQSIE